MSDRLRRHRIRDGGSHQYRMVTVLVVLGLACVVVIGLTIMRSPRVASMAVGDAHTLFRSGPANDRVMFGTQIDWVGASPGSVTEMFGRAPFSYGKFVDFPLTDERRQSVDEAARQVAAQGGILFITLQPYDGLDTVTPESLSVLTADLTRWNEIGTPVMVRFGHEMNGNWYPWGQAPTKYIEKFRMVAHAVRSAPESAIVWSPNEAGGYPFMVPRVKPDTLDYALMDTDHDGKLTQADDAYSPYYPGDDVVDWVGLSLYHFGTSYPWEENVIPEPTKFADKLTGHYRNPETDERPAPDFYATFAEGHDKPMVISETAAAYNTGNKTGASNIEIKRAWWSQVFSDETHQRFPRIKMINWFEQEKVEADFHDGPVRWGVINHYETRVEFRRDLPPWVLFAS
jgi:Glycosyl hydrolase family 26